MKVSLKQFQEKAVAVKNLVDSVSNALPNNEDAELLEQNFDELWSMIIDVCETLDGVFSGVER